MKLLSTSLIAPAIVLLLGNGEISTGPQLLFSSGFEGGVHLGDFDGDYQPILGTDSQTGFHWPIDILGASQSALHFVHHDNTQALESEIQTVIGHDGQPTQALYNIEHYNTLFTQNPYEILNITQGRRDLYIRYWMKMDSASLHQIDKWRAIFEWKTKDYQQGDGFRLIAYVYTDLQGNPYWHWQGDTDPEPANRDFSKNFDWELDNTSVPVPENEWFLTEFYWHWSEGQDGRALWRVNGQLIGDHYGPTTQNSKPIDFIMLTQIYGDANPKHQWVDDIEIWSGLPAQ